MAVNQPTIELEIAPDGSIRFQVSGVPGNGCEDLEKLVLEALGAEAKTREHTPEYHAHAGVADRLRAFLKR